MKRGYHQDEARYEIEDSFSEIENVLNFFISLILALIIVSLRDFYENNDDFRTLGLVSMLGYVPRPM